LILSTIPLELIVKLFLHYFDLILEPFLLKFPFCHHIFGHFFHIIFHLIEEKLQFLNSLGICLQKSRLNRCNMVGIVISIRELSFVLLSFFCFLVDNKSKRHQLSVDILGYLQLNNSPILDNSI